MSDKLYHGSCICGAVRFEAEIDLSKGAGKCNCTACWKRRWWGVMVPAAKFRALAGESELSRNAGKGASGSFCIHCGVTPFARIPAAEWNDGESVSINVACLDDLDPAELIAAPVAYYDGRNDDWGNPPAETRHL